MIFRSYLNANTAAKDYTEGHPAHTTHRASSEFFSHGQQRRLSTESGHLLFCLSSSLLHSEIHSAEFLHIAMHTQERQVYAGRAQGDN